VFLTLRDGAGEASIQLYCRRSVFDSQPRPIVEGLGVVVCAKPGFYVPRGSVSFEAAAGRLEGVRMKWPLWVAKSAAGHECYDSVTAVKFA